MDTPSSVHRCGSVVSARSWARSEPEATRTANSPTWLAGTRCDRRGDLVLPRPQRGVEVVRGPLVVGHQTVEVGGSEVEHAHVGVGLLDPLTPQPDVLDARHDAGE